MHKGGPISTAKQMLEQSVLQAVMQNAPLPMAQVEGPEHLVWSINPAFCTLLGKSEEQLIGKSFENLFPQSPRSVALLDRVLRTGKGEAHVFVEGDAANTHYGAFTCWPINAGPARLSGLMIQVTETDAFRKMSSAINEALLISSVQQHQLTDVSDRLNVQLVKEIAEREKAERDVRAIDARLRLALESAELGTWSLDPATGMFRVDERYQAIFGIAVSELALEQGMDTIHPEDRSRVSMAVQDAMRLGVNTSIETEYRVAHTDGSTHWVLSKGRLQFANEGSTPVLTGFAGTVADITERKELELALVRTAKDLEEVDRRKSEFLATLAHELRNPLAPLRNGLELLSLAEQDKATWDQAHGMMNRQLDHMVRLIDELMDLSRISRGTVDLRLERMDLRTALDQAVETSLPLIERQGHQLDQEFADAPIMMKGDAMRLTQVFANLLNNAAKYTDHGGSISLRADVGEHEARIIVQDNGIGIAPDQLGKVFDMFAQVERTNDLVQGGLGIGLNIVKHLVAMHGGRIEVLSKGSGKGSQFIVTLPLAAEHEEEHIPTSLSGKDIPKLSPLRILIVDDNEDAANMMAMLLNRFGHEVRVAHNGAQALEEGALLLPNVVLMDLGMPVMDGYTACTRMRKTPWGASILLVALSGWGQEEDHRKSKLAGFDHHLVKPVAAAELIGVVAKAIPNPSKMSAPRGGQAPPSGL